METNARIAITFGEQSENHHGMEMIGSGLANEGLSIDAIRELKEYFEGRGLKTDLVDLCKYGQKGYSPACVLVIRDALDFILGTKKQTQELFSDLQKLDWDRKYYDTRRQKVLNKHARANLCFGPENREPSYEEGKGRIVKWSEHFQLLHLKNFVTFILGKYLPRVEVQGEGNLYDDVNVNGIGFHGDSERKIVICASLGQSAVLRYRWYSQSKQVSKDIDIQINHGDLYIMSEKATGWDWKKRTVPTLRHASGGKKYIS